MREPARFARQAGRVLIVVLAVTAVVGVASGAGATTGGHQPASLVDATTDDIDGTTDQVNETTDEVDDTTDELDDTTDDLNDTTDDVDDTNEKLQQTTSVVGSVDTGEINDTLELNATVEGELEFGLDGTLLEGGTLSTTVLGGTTDSGGDNEDESGTDPSAAQPSDDATGAGSPTAGPGPSDAVDAGLVGVLGGLALLGKSAAAGGAGATSAGGGTGAGPSTTVGRIARRFQRLVGTLSSILGNLPLSLLRYSRYDDSDPLDHDTRRDIYEAIEADPGLYLSALEERREVSLSTIRHHLSVLEDEGLLETEKQNGKRRYYPAQTEDVELAAALDEPAKARVLEVLAETGDAHNGRIADALDLDPSTVSHHLSTLEDDGLIERRRDGRTIVNSLTPGVESASIARTDSAGGPDGDATEGILTHGDD